MFQSPILALVCLALNVGCAARQEKPAVRDDIRTIVGGNFTPDGLGPADYDRIKSRVARRPAEYAREFDAMYGCENFDPARLADLYLPTFVSTLRETDAKAADAAAQRLLSHFDAALYIYDQAQDAEALLRTLPEEAARVVRRLDVQRRELRAMAPASTRPSAAP